MKKALAAISALWLLQPVEALAQWQYTQWGMTPEQVFTASSGAAPLAQGLPEHARDGLTIGNVGTHKIGSSSFPATFFYKAGGLQLVELKGQSDPSCWALGKLLEGEYGKPFASLSSAIMNRLTWKDTSKGNSIEFLNMGDVCWLKYSPIGADSGSGL